MRSSIFVIAAAAAALAGTALAQQPGGPNPPADPLGNAAITRADASTRAGTMFDRFDTNHDGKLDPADRAARVTEMFDRIDTNHDGALSRDEFTAAHDRMAERMRGMRGRGGPDHGVADHQGGPSGTAAITRDAFIAGALKRFDTADTNHDGKVTKEERRAAFMAHRRMMRGGKGGRMGSGADMDDMPPPPPPPAG